MKNNENICMVKDCNQPVDSSPWYNGATKTCYIHNRLELNKIKTISLRLKADEYEHLESIKDKYESMSDTIRRLIKEKYYEKK